MPTDQAACRGIGRLAKGWTLTGEVVGDPEPDGFDHRRVSDFGWFEVPDVVGFVADSQRAGCTTRTSEPMSAGSIWSQIWDIQGSAFMTSGATAIGTFTKAGVDLITVMSIVGHKSLKTTDRYARPARDTLAGARSSTQSYINPRAFD